MSDDYWEEKLTKEDRETLTKALKVARKINRRVPKCSADEQFRQDAVDSLTYLLAVPPPSQKGE